MRFAYAASTSTSSESSSAVIFSFASSRMATPSRALTRTPLTSTAPAAGTRERLRVLSGAYSALSPAFSVVASTRASARIGSASLSPSMPLAMVTKLPERSGFGNGLAPQGGWTARPGGLDPDLEDFCLGRLQIIFGVAYAGARAHHLHVARFGAALVAETVLMGDRALADIGDDFHVGVGMRGKSAVRRDLFVVPHPQGAVAHVAGVVMAAEREVVLRLQPAVIGAAEFRKWSEFNHGMLPRIPMSCG